MGAIDQLIGARPDCTSRSVRERVRQLPKNRRLSDISRWLSMTGFLLSSLLILALTVP